MPAATNQSGLLAVCLKEYGKLMALLEPLTEAQVLFQDPDEQQSIKDTIAHRAHWLGLFFVWYEGGLAGEDVQTPAPGYKWNQLKAYNAGVIDTSRAQSWQEILTNFQAGHAKLMAFIESSDDALLYTPKLYPWMNNWTLGRWAEASGASHYRSAAKYVRKLIKMQKTVV